MALWTFFGLAAGKATTAWPQKGDDHGQHGVFGMPRYDPEACRFGCSECIAACPSGALTNAQGGQGIALDYGRCIACQSCTESCPAGALQISANWAFGVRARDDLRWVAQRPAASQGGRLPGRFGRSLHIRHVDAGSCNGCESELQALNNPFYNLHRLGIFFTSSPRFADLLLVTGVVTEPMLAPLKATYEAMPKPCWVMAAGTCAVSGGVCGGNGLEGVLPVDFWLPGCPPNPAATIEALLAFAGRLPQRVRGGHCDGQ